MTIRLKRVYETPSADDGYRILVDRVWPRGMSKDEVHEDLWLRRIAPSDELRKWYAHDVERWPEFRDRYMAELRENAQLVGLIGDIERHTGRVTLLYAAKDEQHNQAMVILEAVKGR